MKLDSAGEVIEAYPLWNTVNDKYILLLCLVLVTAAVLSFHTLPGAQTGYLGKGEVVTRFRQVDKDAVNVPMGLRILSSLHVCGPTRA